MNNLSLNDFELIDLIGTGSFGCCYYAKYIKTGQEVAIKTYRSTSMFKTFIHEANEFIFKLNHPNIMKLLGWNELLEQQKAFIVLSYEAGKNMEHLIKDSCFSMDKLFSLQCLIQITSAIEYIHDKFLAHLDIKPSNIIYNFKEKQCKIIDFGCSRIIDNKGYLNEEISDSNSLIGTIIYCAPELFKTISGNINLIKCDIYSIGITFYQIYHKQIPYNEVEDVHILVFKIVQQNHRPNLNISNATNDLNYLMEKCWSSDPNSRPSLKEIKLILLQLYRRSSISETGIMDLTYPSFFNRKTIKSCD